MPQQRFGPRLTDAFDLGQRRVDAGFFPPLAVIIDRVAVNLLLNGRNQCKGCLLYTSLYPVLRLYRKGCRPMKIGYKYRAEKSVEAAIVQQHYI